MKLTRKDYLKTNLIAAVGAGLSIPALQSCNEKKTESVPSVWDYKPGEVKTAGIRMIEIDGGFKVWTKKFGQGKIKMLTLHGGPGCTHEYFECFEDFLPQEGVEFIYYDQLGSHYSDKPTDKSLWRMERFVEEVESVRKGLGLENFYLYGQSWGGMLGIEYALKYGQHLKGLVISNMTASIPSYLKYVNELRAKFPEDVQKMMTDYESKEQWDAPEYQKFVTEQLYNKHICRLVPWPEPVTRMFNHLATPVYNTMQGNNEFVVTGTFKDWDRWADLHKINIPTQLIVGRYDSMRVEDIQKMQASIPHSRLGICENGSHLSMWDDQQAYFNILIPFLKDVDSGKFKL